MTPRPPCEWLADEFPADWPGETRTAAAWTPRDDVLLPRDARDWIAVLDGPLPPFAPDAASAIADAGPAFFDAALESYRRRAPTLLRSSSA